MGANLFAGAKGKALSEQGVYFTPGFDGEVEVQRCMVKKARKGQMYLVECIVTKTDSKEHPVGAKRTWIQSLQDEDIGFRSVKAFCVAASGIDTKSAADQPKLLAFEEECEGIMTASDYQHGNVFAKAKLRLETTNKPTKAGGPFTLHVWTAKKEEAAAKAA